MLAPVPTSQHPFYVFFRKSPTPPEIKKEKVNKPTQNLPKKPKRKKAIKIQPEKTINKTKVTRIKINKQKKGTSNSIKKRVPHPDLSQKQTSRQIRQNIRATKRGRKRQVKNIFKSMFNFAQEVKIVALKISDVNHSFDVLYAMIFCGRVRQPIDYKKTGNKIIVSGVCCLDNKICLRQGTITESGLQITYCDNCEKYKNYFSQLKIPT